MLNKCKILLHCRTLSIYDSELKNVSSIILQSSAYNHLVFEKKCPPWTKQIITCKRSQILFDTTQKNCLFFKVAVLLLMTIIKHFYYLNDDTRIYDVSITF